MATGSSIFRSRAGSAGARDPLIGQIEAQSAFRISPYKVFETERSYLDSTNIRRTTFTTSKGCVRGTDFLPVCCGRCHRTFVDLEAPGWLVRVVEALDGKCDFDLIFEPGACAFDPEAGDPPHMMLFQEGAASAERVRSTLTLTEGDQRIFVLAPSRAAPDAPADQAEALLQSTADFWRE